ncbi:hypothetical protein V3C10_16575 [[Clostridium] symbiosum]|uniref:DUF6870 family protein n=1 Tax=Clostridium symbiosum TaxID=1512 RepID=UPI001D06FE8E|nr:hypothetical protein [[Clostridium] symbiosum]MCB6608448.1 hypothetical protein [[Clostridium] symbiosum]MCB6930662.1 hypothetical protein [[Clostridium] symbiosum]
MIGGVFIITKNELEKLSKQNLDEIDKSQLKEINEMVIDPTASYYERMKYFFEEIKNPYCFKVNGTIVQIKYNNNSKKTINDCLYNYLLKKKESDHLDL